MKNKKRRWLSKGTFFLVFFSMLIGALALYGTHWSLRATSTTEFCVSCHSMETPHMEWQASVHYSNAKGIQAGCADCHIPHDNDWSYLKAKMHGLKDVYKEWQGEIPEAEAFEAKRGELAKVVWANMKANDSATCRSCHNAKEWDVYAQSDSAQEGHKRMENENLTCIDCHRGIAHFPPDFSGEADKTAGKLSELAKKTPDDAEILFPVAEVEMFSAAEEKIQIGRFLPTAKLEVIKNQDDMQQVVLNSFQQEGSEQVIYARNGKRIIAAVIDSSALSSVEPQGDFVKDEVSGANWRPIRLSVWVPKGNMLANREAIWQYGEELNNAYCGGCHQVIHGNHFTANQWPSVVNGMAQRTTISDEAKLILTYYLQFHAKDITGE